MNQKTMTVTARLNEAQQAKVRDEINRIVSNAKFNTSKRCVMLLRYLVDHAISGNLSGVKERSLGMEVFGRDAQYDTTADPVVRVTASELRKRLARYYQESELSYGVRIRLETGSYLPYFDFDTPGAEEEHGEHAEAKAHEPPPIALPPVTAAVPPARRYRTGIWLGIVASLVALTILIPWLWPILNPTTESRIWKPLLDVNREFIFVCIPQSSVYWTPDLPALGQEPERNAPQVVIPQNPSPIKRPIVLLQEANATHKISGRLTRLGSPSKLRSTSVITLQDFHSNPVVLVGGLDNPWNIRLLSKLRYTLHFNPATNDRWIEDAQNPSARNWTVAGNQATPATDYAIVTRYQSPETGGWIMAMGGLGPDGTDAAVDLITAPLLRNTLPKELRSAHNFQIVLSIGIMNGTIGSPRILTFHTW